MKVLRTMLGLAVVAGLLSGCTLVDQFAGGPGTPPTTEGQAGETSPLGTGGADPGPPPTESVAQPDGPAGAPDRENIQLELNVPHDILGRDGSKVGTITITGAQDNATCPNAVADASKNGKFVIASFSITAEDSLRDQTDPYYGRNFDLTTIQVINPYTGIAIRGGLDYDCLPAGDRLSTVQPGRTETGSLAYDVANEQFAIGWFYGHQWFYVPPSVWGGK